MEQTCTGTRTSMVGCTSMYSTVRNFSLEICVWKLAAGNLADFPGRYRNRLLARGRPDFYGIERCQCAPQAHGNFRNQRVQIRGDIGLVTHFAVSRCRARIWTLVPLTLAHLPLFYRRLDGVMVTHHIKAPQASRGGGAIQVSNAP